MPRIEAWTRELAEFSEVLGKHWVYHEKSLLDPSNDLICRIENISPFQSGFAELSKLLKAPVGQLLAEEAVLFKEKLNFKIPGGDGFKPHQDSQLLRPASWAWRSGASPLGNASASPVPASAPNSGPKRSTRSSPVTRV